jgi:hypothetical protein
LLERVRAMAELGVSAFTIGTAVLDRTIVPGGSLRAQTEAVLATLAESPAGGPR